LSSACSLRTIAVAATTRKATTAGITTTSNTTVASTEGRAHLSSVVHRRGHRVKASELHREREREREITAIVLVDVGVWLLNEHHYQLVEVVVVMMMERALLRLLRSHALRASRVSSSSSLLQRGVAVRRSSQQLRAFLSASSLDTVSQFELRCLIFQLSFLISLLYVGRRCRDLCCDYIGKSCRRFSIAVLNMFQSFVLTYVAQILLQQI
jgi:hypothetical protein